MSATPAYVEAGGLISHGANINEIWRRAAVFVAPRRADKVIEIARRRKR